MTKNNTSQWKDIFISHNWGNDEAHRDNHQRVALINLALNRRGFSTWFDEQQMVGDVKRSMREGLDNSQSVMVCVTKRYQDKVNGHTLALEDNCKMEFDYACNKKMKIIPIAMEETMSNPRNWDGNLLMTLGNSLFIPMEKNLGEDSYLQTRIDLVVEKLGLIGVFPSQMLKFCYPCESPRDGKYCSFCASPLNELKEAKPYCTECNIHIIGKFCNNCGKPVQNVVKNFDLLSGTKIACDVIKYLDTQVKKPLPKLALPLLNNLTNNEGQGGIL